MQLHDMKFCQIAGHLWSAYDNLTTVARYFEHRGAVVCRGTKIGHLPFLLYDFLSCHCLVADVKVSYNRRATIVSRVPNCVRCSFNIDCLSYDSGTFVGQHIFVLFRRIQFGRNERLEKHTVYCLKRIAIPSERLCLALLNRRLTCFKSFCCESHHSGMPGTRQKHAHPMP